MAAQQATHNHHTFSPTLFDKLFCSPLFSLPISPSLQAADAFRGSQSYRLPTPHFTFSTRSLSSTSLRRLNSLSPFSKTLFSPSHHDTHIPNPASYPYPFRPQNFGHSAWLSVMISLALPIFRETAFRFRSSRSNRRHMSTHAKNRNLSEPFPHIFSFPLSLSSLSLHSFLFCSISSLPRRYFNMSSAFCLSFSVVDRTVELPT
ncbi:hypothetical protein HDV57DRAFT_505465 [Trichoderma longibrachiatum]